MEREKGFYWVICDGEYEVAEFSSGGCWYRVANEMTFTDERFDWISDKKIER